MGGSRRRRGYVTVIGTVSEYVVTYGNEKYHSQQILAVLKRPKLFYKKTTERKLLIKKCD